MSPSLDRSDVDVPTTTQIGLIPWAALLLLLVTSVRLVGLNADQYRLYQRNAERKALVPAIGSLAGIDANGETVQLDPSGSEFALVFVLRSEHLITDLRFWNDVVSQVGPGAYAWGVCDRGAACNGSQSEARFRVVGFLDPYGMRSVINAHQKGEALVYGNLGALKARIPRDASAQITADAIRRSLP